MSKTRASSVRPPPAHTPPKNRLLAKLPATDFRRLLPDLTTMTVRPKQYLYKVGEPVHDVYFPNGGVFSITTALPNGTMVEAATVGDEGMLGIEAFFGDNAVATGDTLLQVPDTDVVKISVSAFRGEITNGGALHKLMGQYAQTVFAQMMQSTACNALHQVLERGARWLLMTHDRVRRDDFHLSHEFLAMMLGTSRPTVTVVARTPAARRTHHV